VTRTAPKVRPLTLTSPSAEETRALAGALADHCRAGDLVLLAGDLGAGKTTFAQGFGRALGIADPITSPTFTLLRHYPVAAGPAGVRTMLHADVYRLDGLREIEDLGLAELVEDAGVALVEWGDVAGPVLGEGTLMVRLAAGGDDDRRTVTVSDEGGAWAGRWAALTEALAPWRERR
jgi:tRNA threonylcarbamoyladenosine biosynthesis protein TsaE